MTRFPCKALALAAMALSVLPARAVEAPERPPQEWLRQKILSIIGEDVTWDHVRDRMQVNFYLTDIDQTGITRATIETHRQIQRARLRADRISQVLASDLDGDGIITRDELVTALRKDAAAQVRRMRPAPASEAERERLLGEKLEAMIAQTMMDDADGDGRLTLAEIAAAVDRRIANEDARTAELQRRSGRATPDRLTLDLVPPGLAPDGSDVLTLEQFDAAVRAVFDAIDADKDGRISLVEAEVFARASGDVAQASIFAEILRRIEAKGRAQRAACGLPPLPASGQLMLVGIHGGSGLATVALGEDDGEVGISHLIIEPGAEPLHLALTSLTAQIWVVSGAVDRVATVVATAPATAAPARTPRVGVVGIAPEKVHVPGAPDCIPSFARSDADMTRASDAGRPAALAVERLAGRRPDRVIGAQDLSTMYLPSGRRDDQSALPSAIELPILSRGRAMWQEFSYRRPGGVVRVDPAKVVSRLAVNLHEVLPGEAGVAQLMDEEALEVMELSQTVRLGLDSGNVSVSITPTPRKFKITRKIRIPGGFSGDFLLGRGVPMPDGNLARSCVISEETGRSLGRSCT